VKETDKSQLLEALKFHPNGAQKIGVGIREIKVINCLLINCTYFSE
jgi:DNA-directed RNA polymerase-4 subunit 1